MDTNRRNRLIGILKSKDVAVGQHPGPTVSLEDFFEGNDDVGSIGCNLFFHPGLGRFYRTFVEVRSRADVQDVLVEIKDLVDEHSWPFADTVFVLTSMPSQSLGNLVRQLKPDEVGEFPSDSVPRDLPPLKKGMKILGTGGIDCLCAFAEIAVVICA